MLTFFGALGSAPAALRIVRELISAPLGCPPSDLTPRQRADFDFHGALADAQQGDSQAQELLFERFYPTVERMVHHQLAREVKYRKPWLTARFSTGDVVQEVFRSVLGNLGSFEGGSEGAFAGYLSKIVKNRILDTIRFHEASRRDGRKHSKLLEDLEVGSEQAGPITQAVAAEEIEAYARIIASFPEKEQKLLVARFESETKFTDLAEQLGYSSEAAARRAFYTAQAQLLLRLRKLRDTQA